MDELPVPKEQIQEMLKKPNLVTILNFNFRSMKKIKKIVEEKWLKPWLLEWRAMGTGAAAEAAISSSKKSAVGEVITFQQKPLFSSAKIHGNTLYIAGKGAHFDGDITSHTKHVLDELQKALEANGSSMEKVLKVNCLPS